MDTWPVEAGNEIWTHIRFKFLFHRQLLPVIGALIGAIALAGFNDPVLAVPQPRGNEIMEKLNGLEVKMDQAFDKLDHVLDKLSEQVHEINDDLKFIQREYVVASVAPFVAAYWSRKNGWVGKKENNERSIPIIYKKYRIAFVPPNQLNESTPSLVRTVPN
jgi:hypothetical protein